MINNNKPPTALPTIARGSVRSDPAPVAEPKSSARAAGASTFERVTTPQIGALPAINVSPAEATENSRTFEALLGVIPDSVVPLFGDGDAELPPVPEEIRARWRALSHD